MSGSPACFELSSVFGFVGEGVADFVNLEGMAGGVDGHGEPDFDEVDGAGNDGVGGGEAAGVGLEFHDAADGLGADGIEIGEGLGRNCGEAAGGQGGMGAGDGARAIVAA